MKRILLAALAVAGAVAVAVPLASSAGGGSGEGVRTYVFRSIEDPTVPSHPQNCPFTNANLFLGAHTFSIASRASDSEVVNETVQEIGIAQACGAITTALVPGALVPFYLELTFGSGPSAGDTYTALGSCQVVSNNVPRPAVILAGCALRVTSGPPGFVGGAATSMSIFNPTHQPGAGTGSFWTLRAYFSG